MCTFVNECKGFDEYRYLNRGILNLLAGNTDKAQEDVVKALAMDVNVYTLVSQYFSVRLERNPHDILLLFDPLSPVFMGLYMLIIGRGSLTER